MKKQKQPLSSLASLFQGDSFSQMSPRDLTSSRCWEEVWGVYSLVLGERRRTFRKQAAAHEGGRNGMKDQNGLCRGQSIQRFREGRKLRGLHLLGKAAGGAAELDETNKWVYLLLRAAVISITSEWPSNNRHLFFPMSGV